ncbi:MAG: Dabb family protein [Clostridia bacterium]|nr:Dabb family protein [Clostridia bacterium]
MKHCVLLKVAEGVDPIKVQEKIWKVFQKLDDELDWMNRPVIRRSCMETDSDFDLMAEMELDSEEQLQAYRTHPLVEKLNGDLEKKVVRRATFDHY